MNFNLFDKIPLKYKNYKVEKIIRSKQVYY